MHKTKHNSTQDKTQRAIVVIGAGRSGTSSITRGLQALGVELGSYLRSGGGKNPTGFFEDKSLLSLNKTLRRRLEVRADSVALIDSEAWDQPKIHRLENKARKIIHKHFGHYPLWGYKYGRTLRLLPFWERVFDSMTVDVSYVVAIRNPLSVARSRAKLDKRRGRQEHSDLEWLVSVAPYFSMLQSRSFVVVDYDYLMADPIKQLERIANALRLPQTQESHGSVSDYATTFLQSDMRHSRFNNDDLLSDRHINPVTRDAYLLLQRLANDEWYAQSPEFWKHWQNIADSLNSLAPVLLHIDRVEAELRQSRLNPLGPLQGLPSIVRKLRLPWQR